MARNKNRSFTKRKKEQARQEKAAAKRAKRRDRPSSGGEPGISHISAGPLTKTRPSDDEVQLAIERAMNPGKAHAAKRAAGGGSSRLFVGNLDYGTEETELRQLFTDAGFEVTEASVMRDRMTGEPRGFAFVELAGPDEAERAIQQLHGMDLHGRELRVNAADRAR